MKSLRMLLSNKIKDKLSALPVFQQFGLLFRDKFERLGISSSKTTTIINMHSALNSCVGASYGMSGSANALALNTYWKDRRRIATGLSWTTTGLGPILWPHIITALLAAFGETGAILIISGISLHAVAGALLLQPVEWHSKTKEQDEEKLLKPNKLENKPESGYFSQVSKLKNLSVFSSQYLFNEDDPVNAGYEITDPGVPMMLRANDGYFSNSRQSRSRLSSREGSAKTSRLNSKKPSMTNLLENRSRKSSTLYLNESKKNSSVNLGALAQERETYKPKRKTSITIETQIPESEIEDCPTLKAPQDLKAEEKDVVEKIEPIAAKNISDRAEKHIASSKSLKSFKIDGQYGAKYNKDNHSNISNKSNKNPDDPEEKKYLKDNHSNQSQRTVKQRRKSNNFNYESEVLNQASLKLEEYLKERELEQTEKMKLLINKIKEADDDDDDVFRENKVDPIKEEEKEEQLTLWEKIHIFFDLDLLKDFTFVNLMLGLTLACFSELNFSILTPFILGDYGKTKPEVALFMSILAGVDVSVRFCVPFVAVLAYSQTHWVFLVVAVIIGFGKGLRTVFMALVIPTHVPLHKLPGATGLQLLTAGIVYIVLGPVVGWIKDSASTAVTLHSLNIFTWLTALSWGLEKYIRSRGEAKSGVDIIIDKA
ncbi:Monocarboxylate transporter [Operophtera brumata]|uniref:Monocarboxylate transporter n=1 Tax=Operophtera brumata TaxID=104452 RepID=A0A0L7LD44_OPEBR|nr:Monocarboxylate transporter [Operophtera brumata]